MASLLALLLLAAPEDVSEPLGGIVAARSVPGMVALALRDGEVVAVAAAGARRAGGAERVTPGDRFHLGSCTKAMTATLCATLVERGTLRWDSRICEVFPRTPMEEGWAGVTLSHLLTNRAGAPADLDADGLWGRLWRHDGPPADARRMLLEGVLRRPPEAPPGREYRYSNAGFAIAGHMAESVGKQPWETLLRERLFDPLGIRGAGFGAPEGDSPWGHDAKGRPVKPGPGADNPPAIGPAGTVHMPVGDWAKFVRLHLEQDRLLSKESFRRLHEPVGDYAMGWSVTSRAWAGGEVWTHAGSNTMWYCVAWLAPKKRFAALAMCNRGGDAAAVACDDAAAMLVSRFAR